MPESRTLAAIMFTDIKDFTLRMNADERRGMRLLEIHNEVMDGVLQRHQGSLVKNIGDAYMVSFSSAVNAVHAAVEAQDRFAEMNRAAVPEDAILVRISIHLGDIVRRGMDMFGDGVNIAARLQTVTPPGGICMSREVHSSTKARIRIACASLGALSLKGVSEPVEVWQVETALAPLQPKGALRQGAVRPHESARGSELSIAVMPFANRSDDRDSEYFSDGITEDIITDLARIEALQVSSRNSVFAFKGQEAAPSRVGRELNVRYVLEGSVRRAGARIRITAQLVDSDTNAHLWAERFDRDLVDVFAVQDEIARAIAAELRVRLTGSQEQALTQHGTPSLPAYDLYLRGLFHSRRRTATDLNEAEKHLREAVRVDPGFTQALAALAWTLRYKATFSVERDENAAAEARQVAQKAITLDPSLPDGLLLKGLTLRDDGDVAGSVAAFRSLIEKVPSHAQGHQYLGNALRDAGVLEEALLHHRRAMELDPKDLIHPNNVCEDYRLSGDMESARPYAELAWNLSPGHPLLVPYKVAFAARDRDFARADAMMEELFQTGPTGYSKGVGIMYHHSRGWLDRAYREYVTARTGAGVQYPILPLLCLLPLLALRKLDDAAMIAEHVIEAGQGRLVGGFDTLALAFYSRARVRQQSGARERTQEDFLAARTQIERRLEEFAASVMLRSFHAVLLAATGDAAAAAAELGVVERAHPGFRAVAYYRALVCADIGDREGVIENVRRFRGHAATIWWEMIDEIAFDRWRDDPDFQAVARSSTYR
jgi:adenylate cyclase